MNGPRVASGTVSRDSTRCFYCKEPGHIARLCLRRQEDENKLKRGSTNMMANIDSQFDDEYESYEDLYDEQMEYLNNERSLGPAPPQLLLKQQLYLNMINFV